MYTLGEAGDIHPPFVTCSTLDSNTKKMVDTDSCLACVFDPSVIFTTVFRGCYSSNTIDQWFPFSVTIFRGGYSSTTIDQ